MSLPLSVTVVGLAVMSLTVRSLDSQYPSASRVTVSGSGFEPGSAVRMEIASEPTSAGAGAALAVGATGDVNEALVVPAGSRPGWDDVVLRGVAPDGHLLVEELALQVTE